MWRWWRACNAGAYAANRAACSGWPRSAASGCTRSPASCSSTTSAPTASSCCCASRATWRSREPALQLLAELGVALHLLDAARCRRIEPGLSRETPLHAGIHLAGRRGRQLPRSSRTCCAARRSGAARASASTPTCIAIDPGARPRSSCSAAERAAPTSAPGGARRRRVVERRAATDDASTRSSSAPALDSRALLRRHGVQLPMIAGVRLFGHCAAAPDEAHPNRGPRSALMDERYKVAISRLGNRVRVAGSAEIGGAPDGPTHARSAPRTRCWTTGFPASPSATRRSAGKARGRCCPTGRRCIGASGVPGVWLNLGHGSSGWALACGSARLLADAIGGRTPPIDIDGLGIGRLRATDPIAAIERASHSIAARSPLHDVAATRAIEQRALAATPPQTLMRRAGDAVARLALAIAPHARRVWVAAGPGNNGGDGLEAALHLQRAGREVAVTLLADAQRTGADALRRARARASGRRADRRRARRRLTRRRPISSSTRCSASARRVRRRARSRRPSQAINACAAPRLAIDLPSGLHADRGQPLGAACVRATHTLTLVDAASRASSPAPAATLPATSGSIASTSADRRTRRARG